MAADGHDPDQALIMPGVAPFVGRTTEEARAKYQQLNDLILPGIPTVTAALLR